MSSSNAVSVLTSDRGEETARQWFVDAWRPSRAEDRYEITEITGEVPREIHGTLYRNGPSQNVLPKEGAEALHLFDGDGFVHAFRFDDGRAFYTGRFVRNECFLVEQEEGRYCMTGVGLAVADPTDRCPMRVQPNTNVVFHGGRLLALVENGLPFEIDASTLEPIGTYELEGKTLGMSTSAHPKLDARTGQMILHGYQPFEPYVQYYALEADGRCSLAEPVDAPYPGMMHDVAITENYVIFPLFPVVMDGERLMSGAPLVDALRWAPELGVKFGVRPRRAGGAVRWFEAPTLGYGFHFGNAYEEGGKIVFDLCLYRNGEDFLEGLRTFRRGETGAGLVANPFAYELDLESGTCVDKQLDDRGAEFPRLDDRLVGLPNRYGYCVLTAPSGELKNADVFGTIMKYDRRGGPASYHRLAPGHYSSEPVFVPRTSTADEDDGFVLVVVYEGPTDRSHLAVLDARNLDGPPLAKLYMKHRIPMGFHGNFARTD